MSQAQPADESTRLPAEVSVAPDEAKVTVYVWDLPVRITHWVNVASILVLSVTGYYIANPFIQTQGIATDQFLMGTVRFAHFTTAFIFTVSVLFRKYWAVAPRARYARWDQFLPLRASRRRALLRMVGYYTFLSKEPPPEIGHNPLAGVTYVGLYVLFGLQILTSFALYSLPFHSGVWPTLFGWIITIFGVQPVRLVHVVIMFLDHRLHHPPRLWRYPDRHRGA